MPRRPRFQVGVIGLGVIGSRVAAALRQEGHQVFVWNRSPRREPCFLGSPAAVAESAKILQVFVSDDDAVLGLIDTLGDSLTPEHIFLCHATVSPETARQAAAAVEKRGAKFLDAPFTGSRDAAESRQLTYYIGGEPLVLEKVRAILQASSQQIIHLGKIGDASLIKIACNLVAATQLQAVTEALALVAASQIPPSKFAEAMKHNGASSPLVGMKLPRIIAQNFEPHFALKHMFKDMQHAVRSGERVGLQLPVADVTRSLLFEGLKEGWGDLDFAALARHYFEVADPVLEEKDEPEAEPQPESRESPESSESRESSEPEPDSEKKTPAEQEPDRKDSTESKEPEKPEPEEKPEPAIGQASAKPKDPAPDPSDEPKKAEGGATKETEEKKPDPDTQSDGNKAAKEEKSSDQKKEPAPDEEKTEPSAKKEDEQPDAEEIDSKKEPNREPKDGDAEKVEEEAADSEPASDKPKKPGLFGWLGRKSN